jgi:endonuclease YncB( thermonuclease family)
VGADRLTRLATLVVVVALAAGCRGGGDPATVPPDATTATVEWVNDGDTLTLTDGRKLRLVQIDAPELSTDCYGHAAHEALESLVPRDTRIRLVRDPALDDVDRHGRLLRYVFVGPTNVGVELVRRGAASPYYFRNERGEHADELDAAVEDAQEERAGYWGACSGAELNTGIGSITGAA